MAKTSTNTVHPPLPLDVDAIRILVLEPGDFYDPVSCLLETASFESRPRYIALSYTWGSSYSENTKLPLAPAEADDDDDTRSSETKTSSAPPDPSQKRSKCSTPRHDSSTIILNGQSFKAEHNLYLVLRHLRSPEHELRLWVDAICINQADPGEVNKQVALMSFIYTRALLVVSWLGTRDYGEKLDLFRCMSTDWKMGQTRHLAAFFTGLSRLRDSKEPDRETFGRITKSAYWTRVWIVQEVCLPSQLVLVYGSKVWTYDNLIKWDAFTSLKDSKAQPVDDPVWERPTSSLNGMVRLLDTREARHTNQMILQNLVEMFSEARCTEIRDRVYGLLGLACDVRPYSSTDATGSSAVPNSAPTGSRARYKGKSPFEVNYSKSIYEIWTDVVKYAYSGSIFSDSSNKSPHLSSLLTELRRGGVDIDEARITIVRTAVLIQKALDQRVCQDIPKKSSLPTPQNGYTVEALGYVAGEVWEIGPEYQSVMSSARSRDDWHDCLYKHYHDAADMERLRKVDELYLRKVMASEQETLRNVQNLPSHKTLAWSNINANHATPGDAQYKSTHSGCFHILSDTNVDDTGPARLCLGSDCLIALVPSKTKTGDLIIRF
ncbi:heterokaryon incompatibility protein-domain-containing protein [Xylaria palmicola]|nr:heterokaryon incompatibility protein-domain-containing protein [Xylaria palmicola]